MTNKQKSSAIILKWKKRGNQQANKTEATKTQELGYLGPPLKGSVLLQKIVVISHPHHHQKMEVAHANDWQLVECSPNGA